MIRRLLELLAANDDGVTSIALRLDGQWRTSLAEVGVPDVSGDRATELRRLAKKLFRLLQSSARELQFNRWWQSRQLWADMMDHSPEHIAASDVSLVELLNAAWIGRRDENTKWPIDRINATALDIARRIGTRSGQ